MSSSLLPIRGKRDLPDFMGLPVLDTVQKGNTIGVAFGSSFSYQGCVCGFSGSSPFTGGEHGAVSWACLWLLFTGLS